MAGERLQRPRVSAAERQLRAWLVSVEVEYHRSRRQWGPVASLYEGYAVLCEEQDELWDAIKDNAKPAALIGEARQVVAVALAIGAEVLDGRVRREWRPGRTYEAAWRQSYLRQLVTLQEGYWRRPPRAGRCASTHEAHAYLRQAVERYWAAAKRVGNRPPVELTPAARTELRTLLQATAVAATDLVLDLLGQHLPTAEPPPDLLPPLHYVPPVMLQDERLTNEALLVYEALAAAAYRGTRLMPFCANRAGLTWLGTAATGTSPEMVRLVLEQLTIGGYLAATYPPDGAAYYELAPAVPAVPAVSEGAVDADAERAD